MNSDQRVRLRMIVDEAGLRYPPPPVTRRSRTTGLTPGRRRGRVGGLRSNSPMGRRKIVGRPAMPGGAAGQCSLRLSALDPALEEVDLCRGQGASHGIVPSRRRVRMASAFWLTSSWDQRSKRDAIACRSRSRNMGLMWVSNPAAMLGSARAAWSGSEVNPRCWFSRTRVAPAEVRMLRRSGLPAPPADLAGGAAVGWVGVPCRGDRVQGRLRPSRTG